MRDTTIARSGRCLGWCDGHVTGGWYCRDCRRLKDEMDRETGPAGRRPCSTRPNSPSALLYERRMK